MRFTTTAVILFCFIQTLFSQGTFTGYVYVLDSIPRAKYMAEITVNDGTSDPLSIKSYFDGSYKVSTVKNKTYNLHIEVAGYKDTTFIITTDKSGQPQPTSLKVVLKKDGIRLTGVLKSIEENFPIANATLALRNIMTRQENRYTTDIDGVYNFKLDYETNYRLSVDKRSEGIANKYQDTAFFISTVGFTQPATFKFDISLNEARKKVIVPEGYDAERNPVNRNLKPIVTVGDSTIKNLLPEVKDTASAKNSLAEKPEPKPIHFTISVSEPKKNKPVKGATIRLKTMRNSEVIKTTSDKEGKCKFDLESDKKYVLVISADGFTTLTDTLRTPVSAAEISLGLNYQLQPALKTVEKSETIVVQTENSEKKYRLQENLQAADTTDTLSTTTLTNSIDSISTKVKPDTSLLLPKDTTPISILAEAQTTSQDSVHELLAIDTTAKPADTTTTQKLDTNVAIEPTNIKTDTTIEVKQNIDSANIASLSTPIVETSIIKSDSAVSNTEDSTLKIKSIPTDTVALMVGIDSTSGKEPGTAKVELARTDSTLQMVNSTQDTSLIAEMAQTKIVAVDTTLLVSQKTNSDTTQIKTASTIKPAVDTSIRENEATSIPALINAKDTLILPVTQKEFIALRIKVHDSIYYRPVNGVNVIVKNLETLQFRQSNTADGGWIDLSMTRGKRFRVLLRKSNYLTSIDTITVSDNERDTVIRYYPLLENITELLSDTLPVVYFGMNSSILSEQGKSYLKGLLKPLLKTGNPKVKLYGLCTKDEDRPGLLATKRIDAVISYLLQLGIDIQKISTVNLSAYKPRVKCNNQPCNEEELKQNRCVAIEIIEN